MIHSNLYIRRCLLSLDLTYGDSTWSFYWSLQLWRCGGENWYQLINHWSIGLDSNRVSWTKPVDKSLVNLFGFESFGLEVVSPNSFGSNTSVRREDSRWGSKTTIGSKTCEEVHITRFVVGDTKSAFGRRFGINACKPVIGLKTLWKYKRLRLVCVRLWSYPESALTKASGWV